MSEFGRQVFAEFQESVADFLRRGDRTNMKATLFDALRRTEVTLPVYTAFIPGFLAEVAKKVPAETLGGALRQPGARPNAMHLGGTIWQSLLERERRIQTDQPQRDRQELEFVLDFAGQMLRALRSDGSAFPTAANNWQMPILADDAVRDLAKAARPVEAEPLAKLRRLCASLELYSFLLHGEHRDGIFDHGPYAAGPGEILVIKDFTDLRNDFFPWSTPDIRLDFEAVSVVLRVDAECAPQFNWAGTMTCEGELYDHVRAAAVFARAGDTLQPLPVEAWPQLEQAARAAQRKMFVSIAAWPEAQKIKYGQWLFANHLIALADFVGLDPAVTSMMLSDFSDGVDQEYENLDMSAPAPLWAALRRDPPFTPLEN